MRWRRGPIRRVGWALLGVALLVLAGWVVVRAFIGRQSPDQLQQWTNWANILALPVSAVGIVLLVLEKVTRRAEPVPDQVERALADLAVRIGGQWADEAVRREVTRPAPIAVRWSSTGRPSASRQVVLDGSGPGWRELPLRGRLDPLNRQLVGTFLTLPHRQLTVLGGPGSGKTVFGLLLTLGLLGHRRTGEAVPVMFTLGGWRPAVDGVAAFVRRRLVEDYTDVLAPHGDPETLARRMVDHNLVLPVLDGLDELPPESHVDAVTALDEFGSAGRPFVVTCRFEEYERVMEDARVLSRSAVIELQPVSIAEAIAYLSQPVGDSRWDPIFRHLDDHPDGSLARVLSTPLMVSLARTAYQDRSTTPAELLDELTDHRLIGRLMDAFVTSVYRPAARRSDHEFSRYGGPSRYQNRDRAARWLECLAYQMYRAGTCDLHRWQIRLGLPPTRSRPLRDVAFRTDDAVGMPAHPVTAMPGAGGRPWVLFRVAHVWLALRGWLPWRLARFLDDAYRCGVLRRAGGVYQFRHALLQEHLADGVLLDVLRARAGVGDPAAALPLAKLLNRLGRVDEAMLILRSLGEMGDASAEEWLADLLVEQGCIDELRQRADAGGVYAASRLAPLLAQRGQIDELRERSEAGDSFANIKLVDLLVEWDRADELRERANAGDSYFISRLADVFEGQGRLDEAISILRPLADAGQDSAAHPLARFLIAQDRLDEAIAVLRPLAEAEAEDGVNVWSDSTQLSELLSRQGRIDEAIAVLEALRDANGEIHWPTAWRLADLLMEHGRIDELQALAAAGDWPATVRLTDLLTNSDRVEEAITILRGRAEAGDASVASQLSDLLCGQGRVDEAIAMLGPFADDNRGVARPLLAQLLARHGRADQLRVRADAGDLTALVLLAELHADAGRTDEAIATLRPQVKAGNSKIIEALADLLADQGRVDEAVRLLRPLADAGDTRVAVRVADLLGSHGQLDEAIAVLRPLADANDGDAGRLLAELLATRGDRLPPPTAPKPP